MNRDSYYATDNTGILAADADVYEVDSVFFDDFLKHRNPKPPSQTVVVSAGVPLSFAKQIASSNGKIPHWVCTDFLVYRKDVSQLATITGPSDARRIFQSIGANLLMDLKGSSTLGELYLSILVAHYGSAEDALRHLDPDRPDDYSYCVRTRYVYLELRLARRSKGIATEFWLEQRSISAGWWQSNSERGVQAAMVEPLGR